MPARSSISSMLGEFVSPTSAPSSSQDLKIATGIGNTLILSDKVTAFIQRVKVYQHGHSNKVLSPPTLCITATGENREVSS